MTDQSKEQKPEIKNWLDKLLEKRGIKVQRVEPPKDFIRVMFPGNPPGFADRSGTDQDDPNQEG